MHVCTTQLPTDITYHTRSGGARKVPPLTNAGYLSVDTGNCSPRHIRATMCAPPVSNYMANQVRAHPHTHCTVIMQPPTNQPTNPSIIVIINPLYCLYS